MKDNSRQFVLALAIFEVIFITLFGFFVRYDEDWTDEQLNRKQFFYLGKFGKVDVRREFLDN